MEVTIDSGSTTEINLQNTRANQDILERIYWRIVLLKIVVILKEWHVDHQKDFNFTLEH